MEWLARATNWAKLTATASLGVIHRGHEQEALALMQSYLPRDTGAGAGYSEGGGLYALGLIHANHGAAISDYLLGQLKDAQNEVYKNNNLLIFPFLCALKKKQLLHLKISDGSPWWLLRTWISSHGFSSSGRIRTIEI